MPSGIPGLLCQEWEPYYRDYDKQLPSWIKWKSLVQPWKLTKLTFVSFPARIAHTFSCQWVTLSMDTFTLFHTIVTIETFITNCKHTSSYHYTKYCSPTIVFIYIVANKKDPQKKSVSYFYLLFTITDGLLDFCRQERGSKLY